MAESVEVEIKLNPKHKPIRLPEAVPRGARGFTIRDPRGHEHHFGSPTGLPDGAVFMYIASYSRDGGPEHEYGLLRELKHGREVVPPTLGPNLSPLTEVAVDLLIESWAYKSFAFPESKEDAVHTFLALMEADEPFPPADVEVYAATHGFDTDQAKDLQDLAVRVIQGRAFRPAIKLPRGHGEKLRAYWREQLDVDEDATP